MEIKNTEINYTKNMIINALIEIETEEKVYLFKKENSEYFLVHVLVDDKVINKKLDQVPDKILEHLYEKMSNENFK